jgi:nitrous oxide reductase
MMSESQAKGQAKPSRRGFMLGAAVAGAAGAAAVAIPAVQSTTEATPEAPPPPERGGGYRLSEHVKQYYKTTLI